MNKINLIFKMSLSLAVSLFCAKMASCSSPQSSVVDPCCDEASALFVQSTIQSPKGLIYTINVYNDSLENLGDEKGLQALNQAPTPFDLFPHTKVISIKLPLFFYNMEDVFMKPASRFYYENWHTINAEKKTSIHLKSYGYLTLPEGDAPCPAVVLRHGSDGCNPFFYLPYANLLRRHGIASFLFSPNFLHCFQMAGDCTSLTDSSFATSSDQMSVPMEQTILATFGAAEILASHPRIVGQKIGLMGWSRGGIDVLDCLTEQNQTYINPSVRFSAGVSFYPFPVFHQADTLTAPLLVLLGEEDNYTPIGPVMRYLDKLSGDKTVEIYPHAGHAFDGELDSADPQQIEEKHERQDFQNFSNLYFDVEKSHEGARIFTSPVYAQTLTSQELLPFLMTHMEMGATIHHNREAGEKAKEALVAFMTKHLFG